MTSAAILLEISEVSRAYYAQSATIRITPTDFAEWLSQLPAGPQATCAALGFEACRVALSFQRFCLEWHGLTMREYLAAHLSYEAYCYWAAHRWAAHRALREPGSS